MAEIGWSFVVTRMVGEEAVEDDGGRHRRMAYAYPPVGDGFVDSSARRRVCAFVAPAIDRFCAEPRTFSIANPDRVESERK